MLYVVVVVVAAVAAAAVAVSRTGREVSEERDGQTDRQAGRQVKRRESLGT